MDQAWEIIGIIIAVLMVIIGLRLLLKKPQTSQPIEQTELIVDAQSQQPIVPRHLRPDAVNLSSVTEQSIPASSVSVTTAQDTVESSNTVQASEQDNNDKETVKDDDEQVLNRPQDLSKAEQSAESDEIDELIKQLKDETELVDEAKHALIEQDSSTVVEVSDTVVVVDDKHDNVSQEIVLEQLDSVQIDDDAEKIPVNEIERVEWENEADVIDAHLSEQNRQDEESALTKAEQLIALYMYPNPGRALSGERTLKMLLKYGLRYGEMSCFHRYEDADKPSPLMFSVLRINEDGAPSGFDLETLPSEEVKGLAFFLALPNPHAVTGFDMMVSLAGLMARDTDGMVFDEQSLELTPQLRDHWRHVVIEYKSAQS